MEIRTNVKAGGVRLSNHKKSAVTVRASVRAGGMNLGNHNETTAPVRQRGISWGHGASAVHGRGGTGTR